MQIQAQKLVGHRGQTGTKTNEHVGTQACRTPPIGAFQADNSTAYYRKTHSHSKREHVQRSQRFKNRKHSLNLLYRCNTFQRRNVGQDMSMGHFLLQPQGKHCRWVLSVPNAVTVNFDLINLSA